MKFRGGEFSTGTKGNFQSELTKSKYTKNKDFLFLRQGVRSPIRGVRSFPSPHNADCH